MIFPSRNSRKDLHLPSSRNGSKGHGQSSDPLHFQRRPVDVSYLLLYLIHLPGHGPVPPHPGPQLGLASCRGASGGWGIPQKLHRGQGTLLARLPFRPFRGPASLRAISGSHAASPIFASRTVVLRRLLRFLAPACHFLVSGPAHLFQFFWGLEDFCLAAFRDEFPNSVTSCSGFTRAFSTVSPQ